MGDSSYTRYIHINGERREMSIKVGRDFVDAVEQYDFKNMAEVSKVMNWCARCAGKYLYSWCPADTTALKRYLGIAE